MFLETTQDFQDHDKQCEDYGPYPVPNHSVSCSSTLPLTQVLQPSTSLTLQYCLAGLHQKQPTQPTAAITMNTLHNEAYPSKQVLAFTYFLPPTLISEPVSFTLAFATSVISVQIKATCT